MAEQLDDKDHVHLIMYAVNHIEAARLWKTRWAEADYQLHRLQTLYDKLLREYNAYRKEKEDWQ
ncbi:hypothetical protein EBS40_04190 [bacterium]|nr:hypothetical protein [bacterium]